MNNKEFIKYIKANGRIDINNEIIKENLEICSNANIELIDFYTDLIEAQIKPEVAIEVLSNLTKDTFRLKEMKLFIRKLKVIKSMEGFYFMKTRERILQIYDEIMEGLENKHGEERIQELNQYKVKINTDNTIKIASNRYKVVRDGNHINLCSINDGKVYEHIKCVGIKIADVGCKLTLVFVNESNYRRWNKNNEYFKVLIDD